MVNTRSQVAENQRTHMCRPDRHSDTESESSVTEVLTREQINEFDNGNLLDFSGESERQAVNQRFTEMNRQISELTNLVLALTEKISSNEKSSSNDREGTPLTSPHQMNLMHVPTLSTMLSTLRIFYVVKFPQHSDTGGRFFYLFHPIESLTAAS